MAPKVSRNNVETAMKQLSRALEQKYQDTKTIERGGDRIRIPERMSLTEAVNVLTEYNAKMEEVSQFQHVFDCHPFDGLVCFYTALTEAFGELLGAGQEGAFKGPKIPGRSLTIPISTDDNITVPVGEVEVLGLPIKMTVNPMKDESDIGGKLVVVFETKRMYQPLIDQIIKLTTEKLKTQSIYKGHAINSRFEFFNLTGFEPDKVVYSEAHERQLMANVIMPIDESDRWRKSGSKLKRGVLLAGNYGTGKTLTAQMIAYHCIQNGWTFINVQPGDPIARSLKIAKRYAPAVVFYEDIDQETKGERDGALNEILNVVDGVVGKNDEVMVILTTNHPNKINPALMRPGRLDAVILFDNLDKGAIEKLIRKAAEDKLGQGRIDGVLDMDEIADAALGYTPAFINEAVVKAKAYALASSDSDSWRITGQNIVDALHELRLQYKMMQGNVVEKTTTIDDLIKQGVEKVMNERGSQVVKEAVAEAVKEE